MLSYGDRVEDRGFFGLTRGRSDTSTEKALASGGGGGSSERFKLRFKVRGHVEACERGSVYRERCRTRELADRASKPICFIIALRYLLDFGSLLSFDVHFPLSFSVRSFSLSLSLAIYCHLNSMHYRPRCRIAW